MVKRLDILEFNALDAESNLMLVTNEMMRSFIHRRMNDILSRRQIELYDKLLKANRSRYIAAESMEDRLDDSYKTRYERYRSWTARLAIRCVDDLFRKCSIDRSAIKVVVANTTVGGMVPNITSLVGHHLSLHHGVRMIELGYMGCATALLALEVVEQQLKPGEIGLVLTSELTSFMANLNADSDASLVANTVFGDGVGAFLVAKRPHSERGILRVIDHTGSVQTDEKALSAISYEPNPVYHEIRIHETIPDVAAKGISHVMKPMVRRNLASLIDKVLYAANGRVPRWQDRVGRVVLHTAGRKVLEGVAQALTLSTYQVSHNFEAFRKYGNTSSASIYYALDEMVRARPIERGETLLFIGYGSGFMTRATLMEGLS